MQLQQSEISHSSITFLFNECPVRVYVDDMGTAWFFAKDVFDALEIAWKGASGSLKNYPKKWQRVCQYQTHSGPQDAIFLSEAGVYQTLFNSRKPVARRFVEWVFEEVLPQLRKQGFFGTFSVSECIRLTDLHMKLAEKLDSGSNAVVDALYPAFVESCRRLRIHPLPISRFKDNQLEMEGL